MQVAKYWRNKRLRYRLARTVPKRAQVVEMSRQLRIDARPARLPEAKLTRAS